MSSTPIETCNIVKKQTYTKIRKKKYHGPQLKVSMSEWRWGPDI